MTFKNNWEKTDQYYQLEQSKIEIMIKKAFPNTGLNSYEIISGGCANLNLKVFLEHQLQPFILRVYVRDKDSAFREQKICELIKETVPVPKFYFVGDVEDYRYAVIEYKSGISLREALLEGQIKDMQPIMKDVGMILAKIQRYRFPKAGFFDKDLNIADAITDDFCLKYLKKCLNDSHVKKILSSDKTGKIYHHIEKYGSLLPDHEENHLVHADFDPANILVEKIEGFWKISAVLDFEFAFSGSTLCDVASMLRYAHHMPKNYEDSFLFGLKEGGVDLPKNWKISVILLNILSLLDCLKNCPQDLRPNQCNDILELIDHLILTLDHL